MDLHLDAGATIKAPDNFADYGLPDPNVPADPATGAVPRGLAAVLRPLFPARISPMLPLPAPAPLMARARCFWIWSDKAARLYPPGRTVVARPVLVSIYRRATPAC